MSEPDNRRVSSSACRQLREADMAIIGIMAVIGIAAWRPWPLGRTKRRFTSPENVSGDR